MISIPNYMYFTKSWRLVHLYTICLFNKFYYWKFNCFLWINLYYIGKKYSVHLRRKPLSSLDSHKKFINNACRYIKLHVYWFSLGYTIVCFKFWIFVLIYCWFFCFLKISSLPYPYSIKKYLDKRKDSFIFAMKKKER